MLLENVLKWKVHCETF